MPSSRGLPAPGVEPTSLMSPALAGGFFTPKATWEAPLAAAPHLYFCKYRRETRGPSCGVRVWGQCRGTMDLGHR